TTFSHRDGKTAFRTVVRALHQTFADEITYGVLNLAFMLKIDLWRLTFFASVTDFKELRAAKLTSDFTDEDDHVAFVFEPLSRDLLFIIHQSHHCDRGRRIDDSSRALIIQ